MAMANAAMFTCYCRKRLDSFHDLEAHVASEHHNFCVYSCEFCKYSRFPTKHAVIEHYRDAHHNQEFKIPCTYPEDAEEKMAKIEEDLYRILTAGQTDPTMADLKALAMTVLQQMNGTDELPSPMVPPRQSMPSMPMMPNPMMQQHYGQMPMNFPGSPMMMMPQFHVNPGAQMQMQGSPVLRADSTFSFGDTSRASSAEMNVRSNRMTSTPVDPPSNTVTPTLTAPQPATGRQLEKANLLRVRRFINKDPVKSETPAEVIEIDDWDGETPNTPTVSKASAAQSANKTTVICRRKDFEGTECGKETNNQRNSIMHHICMDHWESAYPFMVQCGICKTAFNHYGTAMKKHDEHCKDAHPGQKSQPIDNRTANEERLVKMAKAFFPDADLSTFIKK